MLPRLGVEKEESGLQHAEHSVGACERADKEGAWGGCGKGCSPLEAHRSRKGEGSLQLCLCQ